jgi:hypothetical protein
VQINHGGGDVGVTEKALDGADVGPGFKQVRRERMPKSVGGNAFGDTRFADGFADLARHGIIVEVVAGDFSGPWVRAEGCGLLNQKSTIGNHQSSIVNQTVGRVKRWIGEEGEEED